MQSRDFCYWLQGFFELASSSDARVPAGLTIGQVDCVRQHLAMVFKHEIDPSMGGPEHQKVLDELHGSKPICSTFNLPDPDKIVYRC
jgi:hypothetical protein